MVISLRYKSIYVPQIDETLRATKLGRLKDLLEVFEMENTVSFENLNSVQLVRVVGGRHSQNYYNGRGTGRNIRAIGTLVGIGASILKYLE